MRYAISANVLLHHLKLKILKAFYVSAKKILLEFSTVTLRTKKSCTNRQHRSSSIQSGCYIAFSCNLVFTMFKAIPQNWCCASKTYRVSKYMLIHETFDLYICILLAYIKRNWKAVV